MQKRNIHKTNHTNPCSRPNCIHLLRHAIMRMQFEEFEFKHILDSYWHLILLAKQLNALSCRWYIPLDLLMAFSTKDLLACGNNVPGKIIWFWSVFAVWIQPTFRSDLRATFLHLSAAEKGDLLGKSMVRASHRAWTQHDSEEDIKYHTQVLGNQSVCRQNYSSD